MKRFLFWRPSPKCRDVGPLDSHLGFFLETIGGLRGRPWLSQSLFSHCENASFISVVIRMFKSMLLQDLSHNLSISNWHFLRCSLLKGIALEPALMSLISFISCLIEACDFSRAALIACIKFWIFSGVRYTLFTSWSTRKPEKYDPSHRLQFWFLAQHEPKSELENHNCLYMVPY